jgi:hypothetical protein
MDSVQSRLTVCFEDPFWVGIFERISGGKYETAKVTFGAEPKDCDVYAFFLNNWSKLRFSKPIRSDETEHRETNPKRFRREAAKLVQPKGIGTKAQQALKLQQEESKTERKTQNREKRKEKHKGHLR